jgi:hypothetical protein
MKVEGRWVPVITKIIAATLGSILQIWAVVWVVGYFEMSPLPFVIGAGILVMVLLYCSFSWGWDAGYEFREAEWSNHEPEERPFITAGLSEYDLDALRKLGSKKVVARRLATPNAVIRESCGHPACLARVVWDSLTAISASRLASAPRRLRAYPAHYSHHHDSPQSARSELAIGLPANSC